MSRSLVMKCLCHLYQSIIKPLVTLVRIIVIKRKARNQLLSPAKYGLVFNKTVYCIFNIEFALLGRISIPLWSLISMFSKI